MTHSSFGNSDPSRGRLRTRSGRRQQITLLGVIEDTAGGWQFTVHLDDLVREDVIGVRDETLELELRDGRTFAVLCDGIDLAERTAVFRTPALPATPVAGARLHSRERHHG